MNDEDRKRLIEQCESSTTVVVTAEHVAAGQSSNGGWSDQQFRLLGVAWPPVTGWKHRVVGRAMPGPDVAEFIKLRNSHLRR